MEHDIKTQFPTFRRNTALFLSHHFFIISFILVYCDRLKQKEKKKLNHSPACELKKKAISALFRRGKVQRVSGFVRNNQ